MPIDAKSKTEGDHISVALVEDDMCTRERLVRALTKWDQLALAYATDTASDMLRWLTHNPVDVLLVDLGLPDRSGIDVIRHCHTHAPATDVMVITMFGDESHMIAAFEAGARGYLLKDGSEDDLAKHVLNLRAGGSPMTPIIARQLLARLVVSEPALASSEPTTSDGLLTAREHELLRVLSRGYTYAESAQLLGVATSTINTHVKNIYSKLAVRSRSEAIFEAQHLGLL